MFEGCFIAGMTLLEGKQITYYLPRKYFKLVASDVKELPHAPKWDSHTSQDVLNRLEEWLEL
jgi:hypothetical protein